MKTKEQITQEYTEMCARLGDAVIKFETEKNKSFALFNVFNQEMLALEAKESKKDKK